MSIFGVASGIASGFANLFGNLFKPKTSFFDSLSQYGHLIDTGIGLASGISNNLYDRALQERLFQRDDTQLTRLMSEYKQNGLNPLLGLPGASVGNTKGFEPTQIQSNFNQGFENKIARDTLYLNREKMRLENGIAREDLQQRKMNNDLERKLLKGKINAQHAYKTEFYPDINDWIYNEEGVDPTSMSQNEKLLRVLGTLAKELFGKNDEDVQTSSKSKSENDGLKKVTAKERTEGAKKLYNSLFTDRAGNLITKNGKGYPIKFENSQIKLFYDNQWYSFGSDTEFYKFVYDNDIQYMYK